jgi:hypothetical protein
VISSTWFSIGCKNEADVGAWYWWPGTISSAVPQFQQMGLCGEVIPQSQDRQTHREPMTRKFVLSGTGNTRHPIRRGRQRVARDGRHKVASEQQGGGLPDSRGTYAGRDGVMPLTQQRHVDRQSGTD